MHEYRLTDKPLNYCPGNIKLGDFILCRLFRKVKIQNHKEVVAPPLPPESDGGNQNEMAPQLPDDHMLIDNGPSKLCCTETETRTGNGNEGKQQF
ncbi:hypothetical protein CASFOL_011156 [Castilleja foliolosa]|uniref:NAC domain-containing protein n=1 Tax=Castilleja foliolosa TaxID=1961234 RepID=A0ABD3DW27_9LAMI